MSVPVEVVPATPEKKSGGWGWIIALIIIALIIAAGIYFAKRGKRPEVPGSAPGATRIPAASPAPAPVA